MGLTLVVIAKNEADRIAACLASAPFADEAVVLDSGSSDGTAEVAAAAGARVIRTGWPGYVAQKNRALAEVRADWALSLDADERLSPRAQADVRAAVASPGDRVGFSLPRCSHWQGRPIRHGRWYPDRKVRLIRRGRGRWEGLEPHDRLVPAGPVGRLDGDILHFPYRSFGEHLATIDRYTRISADALRADGRVARPWDLAVRPAWHLVDALVLRRGLLDGPRGVALAGLGAAYTALKWGRLYRR